MLKRMTELDALLHIRRVRRGRDRNIVAGQPSGCCAPRLVWNEKHHKRDLDRMARVNFLAGMQPTRRNRNDTGNGTGDLVCHEIFLHSNIVSTYRALSHLSSLDGCSSIINIEDGQLVRPPARSGPCLYSIIEVIAGMVHFNMI